MSYAYSSYYGYYRVYAYNGFYISPAQFKSLPGYITDLEGYGRAPTPAFYAAAYNFFANSGMSAYYTGAYGYQGYYVSPTM